MKISIGSGNCERQNHEKDEMKRELNVPRKESTINQTGIVFIDNVDRIIFTEKMFGGIAKYERQSGGRNWRHVTSHHCERKELSWREVTTLEPLHPSFLSQLDNRQPLALPTTTIRGSLIAAIANSGTNLSR